MGEIVDIIEMSIFRPKKNTLFDVAFNKVKELNSSLSSDNTELIQNKWFSIIPNDKKSPKIMGMGDNKHLIYYPENSTPYLHQYEKSIKFVEILSGEVTDQLTGNKYKKGDTLKIYPGEEIQPFTGDHCAYVKVCVTDVDDIWERICNR